MTVKKRPRVFKWPEATETFAQFGFSGSPRRTRTRWNAAERMGVPPRSEGICLKTRHLRCLKLSVGRAAP